jgi:hypothetical protein
MTRTRHEAAAQERHKRRKMNVTFARVLVRSLSLAVPIAMTCQVVPTQGSVSVSATSLYAKSIANFKSEQSVYASLGFGSLTAKGTVASTTLALTGTFFRSGDFSGSVTVDGFVAELRVLGGIAYAKESAKFIERETKMSVTQATRISKEWLRAPNSTSDLTTGEHVPEIGINVTFDSILKEFEQQFGTLRITGTSVINAVPSYVIRGSEGFAMWVTRSTPYLPVDLVLTSDGKFANIDLLIWNDERPPTAPTPSVSITSIHWSLT